MKEIPFPLKMTRAGASYFPVSDIKDMPVIENWYGIFNDWNRYRR